MSKAVEEYLSDVGQQLSALPTELRDAELRELRSHLQKMIERNLADGQNETKAVATALLQFGSPSQLGRNFKRAHQRPQWLFVRPLIAFFAGCAVEVVLLTLWMTILLYNLNQCPVNWQPIPSLFGFMIFILIIANVFSSDVGIDV